MKFYWAIAFIAVASSSCDLASCSNIVSTEKISPDGEYIATVFERNCGATTSYLQIVSLRRSKSNFDPDEYKDWIFSIEGKSNIKVRWLSSDKVSISFTGTGASPELTSDWRGISVLISD